MTSAPQTRSPSLKRNQSDMRSSKPPLKWIDDQHYRTFVLQLPGSASENDIDRRLKQEADDLDIPQLQIATDVEAVTVSLSATTIASEPTNQSSILSDYTAPSSTSSSNHRLNTSTVKRSDPLPATSAAPLILTDMEKKRKSGFRNGIRKMTGFSRKRKTPAQSSPTLSSLRSSLSRTEVGSTVSAKGLGRNSLDFDLDGSDAIRLPRQSPSLRSNKSSSMWSTKMSATTKSSCDHTDTLIDHDALQRTIESAELTALRTRQTEERLRFLDYQTQILSSIRAERDQLKADKRKWQTQVIDEQIQKNDRAVEDLESRQLEDELKMIEEHENEKRSILARLRHMEAYCQNPSPPPTPIEFNFSGSDRTSSPVSMARGSVESVGGVVVLPERKVTDKDYHNLASCYRERDAMDNLHASKINVLRGKQKRAVENFVTKKEREVEKLEMQQAKEIDEVDREFGVKEAECRAEFWEKRQVLEKRWKLQAMIEKVKVETKTGLKYEVLPHLTLSENETAVGYGVAK